MYTSSTVRVVNLEAIIKYIEGVQTLKIPALEEYLISIPKTLYLLRLHVFLLQTVQTQSTQTLIFSCPLCFCSFFTIHTLKCLLIST